MSPLIVRTLEVPDAVTLDVLQAALLACFGWSGEASAVFTIRGVGYCTEWMIGAADARPVTVGSLGLRAGERFVWAYDPLAGWIIDLRVEAVIPAGPDRFGCVEGRRAGPAEEHMGVAGFYAWEDSCSVLDFIECLGEIVEGVDLDGRPVDEAVTGPGCGGWRCGWCGTGSTRLA